MAGKGPIILTGVNGFCASRLLRYLKETENEPVLGYSHRDLDITDRDACFRLLKDLRPRAVIHSAAISHMPACEKDPELSFKVNVLGPEYLAIACEAVGARLIHFSTDQTYNGTHEKGPHIEDMALLPRNVYGRHKKEAEERIAAATQNYAAIRLTWMYDFPARNIYTSGNLITMCQNALYANRTLTLSSRSGRGITYVYEVIENIPALMDAPAGVYNFGSCSDMSTYEAAKRVFTLLGAGSRIAELVHPENEAPDAYPDLRMDCKKAAVQGIRFSTTEDGIEKAFLEYGYK